MKNKSILLITTCIIALLSCNQKVESQTPEAVKTAFQTKYPGENDPDWEMDSNGNYESHFKIDGIKYRADFSPNGDWVETETSIDKKDLPKAIKEAIKKNYGSEEITEIEKVDSATKGEFYDVEFKQKGKNKDVEFRASGEEL
ncbi:PepSY-like domain-containing protein [Lacinutrix chionoecetis]